MVCLGLIAAGGTGRRLGNDLPKQFLDLAGKSLIAYSLEALQASAVIDRIAVAMAPGWEEHFRGSVLPSLSLDKLSDVITGGARRQESVLRALRHLSSDPPDIILIHDAARPFLDERMITDSVKAAQDMGAAVIGTPLSDTVKEVDQNQFVRKTLDRGTLWTVQTPQTFRFGLLLEAHELLAEKGIQVTDDASCIEATGGKVKLLPGPRHNIKVTLPEDFAIAYRLLQSSS